MTRSDYPEYIVRMKDYTVFQRYEDTNLYRPEHLADICKYPPYDWWTYEFFIKSGFFPIDKAAVDSYNRKNRELYSRIEKENRKHKGCGWEDED